MEQSQPVNKIGRDFNFWQFFRFALPTLATQLFLAIFKTIDDGLFVSNFVGADALSAINIVFPLIMLMGGPGMIFAAGGSAVCARKMGEGKPEEAKRCFTTITLLCVLSGMVMGLTCLLFQRPLLRALGATELLMEDCIVYSTITFIDFCFTMSCPVFDFFYSAAGKPGMSMVASLTNGAVNIICDVIFIVMMDLGVLGAALSTFLGSISFCTVGLIFYCNKKHEIHFTTPAKEVGTIVKDVFSVGIASFANTLAMAAGSYIANLVMLDLVGEDGVAAYAIFGYLQYIMGAMLFGFCDGVAAIFSYNYGARNKERIRKYFWYAMKFMAVLSLIIIGICVVFREPLIALYVNKAAEPELYGIVKSGFIVASLYFLFNGVNMFGTKFFTSMGDGKRAAIMSFLRNGVLVIATISLMPMIMGLDGVWWSFPVGETIGFLMVGGTLYANRDNYGYGPSKLALKLDD